MRKNRKWSIPEKNILVQSYFEGKRVSEIIRENDIADKKIFYQWVRQYKVYGTTVDGRGKSYSKPARAGRPKSVNPDEMTLEELREYVKLLEDIKKTVGFLRLQKKNIKS